MIRHFKSFRQLSGMSAVIFPSRGPSVRSCPPRWCTSPTRRFAAFKFKAFTATERPILGLASCCNYHGGASCSTNVSISYSTSSYSTSSYSTSSFKSRGKGPKRLYHGDDDLLEALAEKSLNNTEIIAVKDENGEDLNPMSMAAGLALLKGKKDRRLVFVKRIEETGQRMFRILPKGPKETSVTLSTNIALADLQVKVNALLRSLSKGHTVSLTFKHVTNGPSVEEFTASLRKLLEEQQQKLVIKPKPPGGLVISLKPVGDS